MTEQGLTKDDKLKKILIEVKERDISAYKISKATKISEAGVGKILNKLSKNPQISTVDKIYNYLFSNSDYVVKSDDAKVQLNLNQYTVKEIAYNIRSRKEEFTSNTTFLLLLEEIRNSVDIKALKKEIELLEQQYRKD